MDRYSIQAENVSVSYKIVNIGSIKDQLLNLLNARQNTEDVKALDNVSFSIEKGQTVGLIGSNGSGKSTLLKTLAGIFKPDSGKVELHSNSISLLSLGTGFEPKLSGIQNIYTNGILMGLKKGEIDSQLNQIITFADIGDFIYRPVRTYSSGMRSRLAFAIASNVEPNVLLLDEMMGVGDQNFRQKSAARIIELIRSQRTVILASHNMATIQDLCSVTLWLHKGKLADFGRTDTVIAEYMKMVRQDRRDYNLLP